MIRPPPLPPWARWGSVALAAALAVVLLAMGRIPWCAAGDLSPVSLDTWSPHNSQHLLDAYSFTHFQHGLVFFLALAAGGRSRWIGPRWLLALGLEGAWEILENTPLVIERYRTATVSLGYDGDSVANSLSDLACCALGYQVAARVPAWATGAVFVAIELALIATLRDSLLLNVLMLVWPLDAVARWQAGGH